VLLLEGMEEEIEEAACFVGDDSDQDARFLPFFEGVGDTGEKLGELGEVVTLDIFEFVVELLEDRIVGEVFVLFDPLVGDAGEGEEAAKMFGFGQGACGMGLIVLNGDLMAVEEFDQGLGEAKTTIINKRSLKIKHNGFD
jgi:hypothetical protein